VRYLCGDFRPGDTMDEHREQPRRRTLKSGKIEFNGGGAISCTVRNVSQEGACLEFESPMGVPNTFILLIESDHAMQSCQVRWRKGNRIGVVFAPN
jgi:hypothetical protein